MPHLATHERAAAAHDRAALAREEAAELYDGVGSHSLARQERARARWNRDAAALERELARQRGRESEATTGP